MPICQTAASLRSPTEMAHLVRVKFKISSRDISVRPYELTFIGALIKCLSASSLVSFEQWVKDSSIKAIV